jgi:RNA polymerase sigma-70 factor (ECF subfamily)
MEITGLTGYLESLRASAMRLTASEHEAEDLVQDCLASAVQGVAGVRKAGLLGAWLHQILRRRWYDLLRRRAVERRHLREGRASVAPAPAPDDELVRRALAELDADARRVLELRFFQSRSSVEIGTMLGRSPGSVRSLLFHSLRKFEARFRTLCPKETP